MSYYILDRESVPAYLLNIPAVADVLGSEPGLVIDEIGDGNLNYVYRVTNSGDESRSVILKQAVPYLRMVGEEWPLSRDRMTFEIRALQLYNEIVPNFVPTIYHADEAMSTLVMQNLDDHIILRAGMIAGVRYPNVAEHIGTFMGETLFRTSSYGMQSEPRRRLMDRFALNAELCKLTEEFVFTFPYMEHDSNYSNPATDEWARANLRNNARYKLDVLQFKNLFLTKADALLHADLHTGSLMVNQAESYVIDMEFAYFGPFGFDVGKIISNFILCATASHYLPGGADYRKWILEQIPVIWSTFRSRFLELWDAESDSAMLIDGLLDADEYVSLKESFMDELLKESVGFAACSMARRTLGIAGVADIRDIEDLDIRAQLEITNLELSMKLMAGRRSIKSIDDVLATVTEHYGTCTYGFCRSVLSAPLIGIIPAAGSGLRARPYTYEQHKGMFLIDGRPNIERLITTMRDEMGIDEIVLVLGYMAESIKTAFGDGSDLGVRINYVENQHLDKGWAWSVLLAKPFLAGRHGCIMLADEFYLDTNHSDLARFNYTDYSAVCTVKPVDDPELIKRNFSVEKDGTRIIRLVENPESIPNNLLGMATFTVSPDVLQLLEDAYDAGRPTIDFVGFIDELIRDGHKVAAFELSGDYVNLNDVTSLEAAQDMAIKRRLDGSQFYGNSE